MSRSKRPDTEAALSSRRGFLAAAGGLAMAAGTGLGADAAPTVEAAAGAARKSGDREPFWGEHQGGIATPQQKHCYFAALDLQTEKRDELVAMLRAWTDASARMTNGETAAPLSQDPMVPAADSGDGLDLAPARLTPTFGLGTGLFVKDGRDRYGLARHRPEALIDMPDFNGDQMVESRTGGDLAIQACADDPQIAFHAVRQLARLAYGTAQIRWVQTGFTPSSDPKSTPRNLMGFKDGTVNPRPGRVSAAIAPAHRRSFEDVVWVGGEGPAWMRGGSYLVARRIRISLEHWDRTEIDFQELVIGRHKYSGAPLGAKSEFAPLALDAADKDGNPVIPEDAHVRLATAATNDGAQILRRAYSYNEGVNFTAERWPPWRQGMAYDAGLFFLAYQRDPRTGFIKIFENMAKLDALNQFTTHVGGGLFACPGGVRRGAYIAQGLFEAT